MNIEYIFRVSSVLEWGVFLLERACTTKHPQRERVAERGTCSARLISHAVTAWHWLTLTLLTLQLWATASRGSRSSSRSLLLSCSRSSSGSLSLAHALAQAHPHAFVLALVLAFILTLFSFSTRSQYILYCTLVLVLVLVLHHSIHLHPLHYHHHHTPVVHDPILSPIPPSTKYRSCLVSKQDRPGRECHDQHAFNSHSDKPRLWLRVQNNYRDYRARLDPLPVRFLFFLPCC